MSKNLRRTVRHPNRSGQHGFTLLELIVIGAITLIVLAASVIAFQAFILKAEVRGAASRVESLVQSARINALKEKNSYRLVFSDTAAANPNRIELQRDQSGTYTTLDDGVYDLDPVDILGSGSTDSMNSMTVNDRGVCSVGKVYMQGEDAHMEVVDIEATCQTRQL